MTYPGAKMKNDTRIEFFRKNYREIHSNQSTTKFLGIFTVFTVIFDVTTVKIPRKFGYSLIAVNFTIIFPEKFYPCVS